VSAAIFMLAETSGARADEVQGTRSEKLKETSHAITATLRPGHAKLVVQRTVWNGGERHDQATFHIMLPSGAVATRLRTLGELDGRPRWFEGDLMEAEAAAAKYRELTGIGGYYPKDPALLSWRSRDHLALQVFPCAPAQPKTISYTLEVPTTYRDGRHHLALPRVGTETLAAKLVLADGAPGDALFVDGKPAAPGSLRALGSAIQVALERRRPPTLDGRLAVAAFAKDRTLVHFGLEAAPRLSAAPRNAAVVVIVDGSRSMRPEQTRAGIAAARAMLSHLADAKVEVLVFDREVRARHGGFVPVKHALSDLAALSLTPRNGSAVDAALARADAMLAAVPKGSARRVLLLTDLRTRNALDPEKLSLASGAIVHVGIVDDGQPRVERDDEHAWNKVVRPTGGLVWRGAANVAAAQTAPMLATYEEWARPVRIDRFQVVAPGIAPEDVAAPERLDEGQGFSLLRITDARVPQVTVRGELWATPIRKVISPDESEARLWSALVFGSELVPQLTETEMMTLALRGRAVSPVTSYLAIEPGVRPSTEGLEIGESFGFGGLGLSGVGIGTGAARGAVPAFDREKYLSGVLGRAWKGCGAGSRTGTATVETTLAEVVDVPSVKVDGAHDGALVHCMTEAIWSLALPTGFIFEGETFAVKLS
jgi:hypothetical protein